MEIIDWVEKAHGLITLAIDIKEGVDGNKGAFEQLKAKLRRIDLLISTRVNKILLNESRPKALTNLIDHCQHAVEILNKYSDQSKIMNIINFDQNSSDFKTIDRNLDDSIGDLTFHIQSAYKRIIPTEFKDYVETPENCVSKFSQSLVYQLVIWIDSFSDINLPNIRNFFKQNPNLLFIQCTCWEEAQQFLDDERVSAVAKTLGGFFRLRIIAHPQHPMTLNGERNPNAIPAMLETLYEKFCHISVFVYGNNLQVLNEAKKSIKSSKYPYAGASREERDLRLFCQCALVLCIGDFNSEEVKNEFFNLRNKGYSIIQFDRHFFDTYSFDLPWAEEFVQQAIKFSTENPPTKNFSVLLSSSTEAEAILLRKIKLVQTLKTSDVWQNIRILFYTSTPRSAILELCSQIGYENITSNTDLLSWLRRTSDIPSTPSPCTFKVIIKSINVFNVRAADRSGTSDPYCVVKFKGSEVFRTETRMGNLNPSWNINREITVTPDGADEITFILYDWNRIQRHEFLGGCSVQFFAQLGNRYKDDRLITLKLPLVDVLGTGMSGIRGDISIVFWFKSQNPQPE